MCICPYAALPKAGIEVIPKQLSQNLKQITFKFNIKVTAVKDGEITLGDNTKLESDYAILATDASGLIENHENQIVQWKSCDTLYYDTGNRNIRKPLIVLFQKKEH